MMVTTKFRGATNSKGECIRVTMYDESKTSKVMPYPYELSGISKVHGHAVHEATGKVGRMIGQFENGTVVWEVN